MDITDQRTSINLYWIPLGAGGWVSSASTGVCGRSCLRVTFWGVTGACDPKPARVPVNRPGVGRDDGRALTSLHLGVGIHPLPARIAWTAELSRRYT
jgi:hypothetical protein